MTRSLPNYIRTLRKREALSQEDLAFLTGDLRRQSIDRHERFENAPRLAQALAYAAVFRIDPRELFAGLHEGAQAQVRRRAKQLIKRSKGELPTKTLETKLAFLEELSGSLEPHYVPWEEEF